MNARFPSRESVRTEPGAVSSLREQGCHGQPACRLLLTRLSPVLARRAR
jgi:hypothetical protein